MVTELDLGRAGFWLAIGLVIAAYMISEAIKQKSLHRLIETSIEKTGAIDPKLAELIDQEIARKAQGDGFAWERSPVAGRMFLSGLLVFAGLILGFLAFAISMGIGIRAAGSPTHIGVFVSLGIAAAVVGLFGLIARRVWPKSKKPSSDPLP